MKCGTCNKTDGLSYYSNPAQVRCTITGKFHYGTDVCDCTSTAYIAKLSYSISCAICDEIIRTSEYPPNHGYEICDKCKAAVMAMRKQMDLGKE